MRDFELSPDDATAQRRLIRLRAEQDALSRANWSWIPTNDASTAPRGALPSRGAR